MTATNKLAARMEREAMVEHLQAENARLRAELERLSQGLARAHDDIMHDGEVIDEQDARIQQLEAAREEAEREIKHLKGRFRIHTLDIRDALESIVAGHVPEMIEMTEENQLAADTRGEDESGEGREGEK